MNKKFKNKNINNIKNNINNENESIIEGIDTTVYKNMQFYNDNNIINSKINLDEPDYVYEENNKIKFINPNIICHRIIQKGIDIDISNKICYQCYKLKYKSNFFSFITGVKELKIPYLIFFDENFYYMVKDKQINNKNKNIRRIGNRYDLSKLRCFRFRKINQNYEFEFEFYANNDFERAFKYIYFEQKEAEVFLEDFQEYVLENLSNVIEIKAEDDIIDEENEEEDNEEQKDEDNNKKENIKVIKDKAKMDIDLKNIDEKNYNNNIDNDSTKEESKDIGEV